MHRARQDVLQDCREAHQGRWWCLPAHRLSKQCTLPRPIAAGGLGADWQMPERIAIKLKACPHEYTFRAQMISLSIRSKTFD